MRSLLLSGPPFWNVRIVWHHRRGPPRRRLRPPPAPIPPPAPPPAPCLRLASPAHHITCLLAAFISMQWSMCFSRQRTPLGHLLPPSTGISPPSALRPPPPARSPRHLSCSARHRGKRYVSCLHSQAAANIYLATDPRARIRTPALLPSAPPTRCCAETCSRALLWLPGGSLQPFPMLT